ncbi:hypothetical protein [Celeribacter sp.]|uniref:hypothetical protein n=1 Tax=Celeribacter sp. TaxID=1890673 RepID=UPI003A918ECB
MGTNVKGSVGLPGLNFARFQADRAGRTKATTLVSSAKRKTSPPPQKLPEPPRVKTATLLAAARNRAPQPAPNPAPNQAPNQAVPPQLNAPQNLLAQPAPPPGPPPMSPAAQARLAEMPGEVAGLATRAEAFIGAATTETGTRAEQLTERKALMAEIGAALAEVEQAARFNLARPEVDALRMQLVGLALDVALPDLAQVRADGCELGDEVQAFLVAIHAEAHPSDQLRDAHAGLSRILVDMRAGFADRPEIAAEVTGAFLKAMADTPLMRGTAHGPVEKMQMLEQLTRGLAHGLVTVGPTPLLNTESEGAAKVLSALRAEHYADGAARHFLATLDPQAEPGLAQDVAALGAEGLRGLGHEAIRARLPERLRDGLDAAVTRGREGAALRDAYEAQATRTARALGPDLARLAEASVLLKARGTHMTGEDGAPGQAPDAVVDEMLQGLAGTNRQAAFQVAKLALTMERLATAEEATLGYNQFGIAPDERFDAAAILQITGLSEKDITSMGYALGEVGATFQQNMERLGKAGFTGVGQVNETMDRMRGLKAVIENRDIQDNLRADLRSQTRTMGTLLQKEIATDAMESFGAALGDDLSADGGTALAQVFAGIGGAVHEALFATETGAPSETGQRLDALQADLAVNAEVSLQVAQELTALEDEILLHQEVLADYAATHGRIDSRHPEGLKSAQLILKVIDLDATAANHPEGAVKAMIERERDAALRQLKGFDATLLKRSWSGRMALGGGRVPGLDAVRGLKDQARAIVFLRETGPERMAGLRAMQTELGLARAELLAERRDMAPNLLAAVDRIIHSAVLSQVPFDAAPTDVEFGFNPEYAMADKREEIVAQLQDWGLDTEAFATEIDRAIEAPLTGRTLADWQRQADRGTFDQLLDTGLVERAPAKGSRFGRLAMDGLMFLANKRRIGSQMRQELAALVEAMPNGSKFDLMSGTEIKLNTGRIPLEPTATITLRGRLAGSLFKSMVIETGSSGEIKLLGMAGGTAKLGADLQAAVKLAEAELGGGKAEVKLAAQLSADAGGELARGFQLSFPKGEAGRQAALDTLLRLTERQRPSAEIFETASDVSSFHRQKGSVGLKSAISAKAAMGWQPGGNDGDMFDDGEDDPDYKSGAKNKHGFGISAGITARVGMGGKKEVFHGLDKSVVKTEVQTEIGISAKASLYAQTFTALGMGTSALINDTGLQRDMDERFDKGSGDTVEGSWTGGDATMATDIAGISADMSVTSVQKKKLEFDVIGEDKREVLTKVELKEITDGANTPTMHHIIASFSDGTLERLRDTPEKLAQVRGMIDEIGGLGLSSSRVEVAYNIKSDKLALANELFLEAELARSTGDKRGARMLVAEAQAILDDRENYAPAKISLIDKTSAKASANRGRAPLIELNMVSKAGVERVVMSVGL